MGQVASGIFEKSVAEGMNPYMYVTRDMVVLLLQGTFPILFRQGSKQCLLVKGLKSKL